MDSGQLSWVMWRPPFAHGAACLQLLHSLQAGKESDCVTALPQPFNPPELTIFSQPLCQLHSAPSADKEQCCHLESGCWHLTSWRVLNLSKLGAKQH